MTVAFNRPEVTNATNPRMHQELVRVFPEIGRDPEAHVMILTGEGGTSLRVAIFRHCRRRWSSLDDHARRATAPMT